MKAELDRATRGLESFFLRQVLKEAVPNLGGESQFGGMLQDALADELAKNGGLGVAQTMQAQLAGAVGEAPGSDALATIAQARIAGGAAHGHPHSDHGAIAGLAPGRALKAYGITSTFGARVDPITGAQHADHHGIDLRASMGQGVRAAFDGTIVRADHDAGGYGQLVVVDHGDGVETRYAHLSAIDVRPGQRVRQGETIGAVGSSGRSTGPHLHFEVRQDGTPVDPTQRLDPRSVLEGDR